MAVTVTHATVTAVPDDPAYDIGSDEWNAAHSVSGLGTAAESAATDFATAAQGATADAAVQRAGDTMTGTLTSTLGTITANTPNWTGSQEWNNASVVFTGFKYNVLNTACDTASKPLDIQVNGSSKLSMNFVGGVLIGQYLMWTPSSAYIDDSGGGYVRANGGWQIGRSGSLGFYNTAPIAQPTVTGAKGGNAALTSLLTQLANLGLIVDSTT